MKQPLQDLPVGYISRQDLSLAVTPFYLKESPIHRWFYFPHSFSTSLVETLLDHWGICKGQILADPFVGSGTSVVVAQHRGVHSYGFDLLPLAALISRTKVGKYDPESLRAAVEQVIKAAQDVGFEPLPQPGRRLAKAFTSHEYALLSRLSLAISHIEQPNRDFLLVVLLAAGRRLSRARADGGWFRWRERPDQSDLVLSSFEAQAESMIGDLDSYTAEPGAPAIVQVADARSLPLDDCMVDVIITSPPYPNRHDYSRIFHIELLLLGIPENSITDFRYHTLRSHVEARPVIEYAGKLGSYLKPLALTDVESKIPRNADPRIVPLIRGYCEDMYLSLSECARVLKPGGKIAFVVGNVRHGGVMVPVDQIVAEIGDHVRLRHESTWVARVRGNSAQQMGRYGRVGARESIVLLRKQR